MSESLPAALRATAARLAAGSTYQWGHHGQCNCGHLVETVCGLAPPQIHRLALERDGDWEALANNYCPTSGYAIDDVITQLLALGMTTKAIAHLERLDDPRVLRRLGVRALRHNVREDAVAYMNALAALLDEECPLRRAA